LGAAVLPWPATAQGVPIVDPKSIIQHGLEIAQMSYLTGGRELEADKKRRIDELHQDQLDALDATLAMMTGQTPWIGDLEVIPGAEAEVLYAVEDNNPYAARLFGDAKTSIEEMIVATAQKYAGHPGLARAGLNPVEFRIWFQSLVKQESGFSIGARSPVGAFGLTQVMPDTAKDLGIYPAYYDDPMLQLDGGARYFLTQLNKFGSVPLALAAYNAGPAMSPSTAASRPLKRRRITSSASPGSSTPMPARSPAWIRSALSIRATWRSPRPATRLTLACTMAWPPLSRSRRR
jgi:hypothetical protein